MPDNFIDYNYLTYSTRVDMYRKIYNESFVTPENEMEKQKKLDIDKTIGEMFGLVNFINNNKSCKINYDTENTEITFPKTNGYIGKITNKKIIVDLKNKTYNLQNIATEESNVKTIRISRRLTQEEKIIKELQEVAKKYKNESNFIVTKNLKNIDKIKKLCFVKIKDYKKSSVLFGYSIQKKEMFESSKDIAKDNGFGVIKTTPGERFIINDILLDYKCKKDGETRNILQITYKGKNLKFVDTDVEIIYPNITELTKGITMPKVKKLSVGCKIKLKNKSNKPVYGKLVEPIFNVGNIKYASVMFDDSRNIQKIRIKNLKII